MWIKSYSTSTVYGVGPDLLWSHLKSGKTLATPLFESGLIKNRTSEIPNYFVHLRRDLPKNLSFRERLNTKLQNCWESLPSQTLKGSVGVILASTKGFIEDLVWNESSTPCDTLTPLLDDFITQTKIKVVRQAVVSNACSSVAASLKLAQTWLETKSVDTIVIISADTVSEFVVRGFHSLHALTPEERAKPFDQNRMGLQLGEAAAILVLTNDPNDSEFCLKSVAINCEGVAATRPDEQGRSLYLALTESLKDQEKPKLTKPKLVVAHGTGTPLNDATEDFVFQAIYNEGFKPQITGIKWGVGHTLGVSCALDIVASLEMLKHQEILPLPFTGNVDSQFKGNYVLTSSPFKESSVLISSLGFGGVHAGLYLKRGDA